MPTPNGKITVLDYVFDVSEKIQKASSKYTHQFFGMPYELDSDNITWMRNIPLESNVGQSSKKVIDAAHKLIMLCVDMNEQHVIDLWDVVIYQIEIFWRG